MKEYKKWVSLRTCLEKYFWKRINLVEKVYGTDYRLEPRCPDCKYQMGLYDVLRGFRLSDPLDFTTKCPNCGLRFELKNRPFEKKDKNGFQFYCSTQVLAKLKKMGHMKPEKICSDHPDVYHSTLIYFGSIKAGMKRCGIKYQYEEKCNNNNWKVKVYEFLGKVPDRWIADVVGVHRTTVCRFRNKKKIKPFLRPREGYYEYHWK